MANYQWYVSTFISWYEHMKDQFYMVSIEVLMTWWHKEPRHQHPWCWFIDLANWDSYPCTSRVKIKCWKCIRTAVELGWNSFFKTLTCWILKGNHHDISWFCIYVGVFAWLATKIKSRLKSSDIKFCLIANTNILLNEMVIYIWLFPLM